MRRKRDDYPLRVKILQTAFDMYTHNGFTLTTNQMIATKAHCSTGQVTNFFRSKENILLEVVRRVLPFHQSALAKSVLSDASPAVRYCMEIAAELAMCEQSATARDLYINTYTLPLTWEFIREYSYKKSVYLFSERLPAWSEQDFFETEAMTLGIVYGGLMDKCNPRYSLEQKLLRVLDALLKVYEYNEAERKEAIKTVLSHDIEKLASDAQAMMHEKVEESINAKETGG